MLYKSVRGTKDLFGSEAIAFDHIMNIAYGIATKYNFTKAYTPTFENVKVFARNLGLSSDIVNKEMYTFMTQSNEELALKPEGTASLARMLLQHNLHQELPAKFFYNSAMFRYERPQKGRQREFHQFGVEHFGANSAIDDAVIIHIATIILKKLFITDIEVVVNSLGSPKIRHKYSLALIEYFQSNVKELSPDSKERLNKNPLRILDSKADTDQKLLENAPKINNFYDDESKDFFSEVLTNLKALGVEYTINPLLVRGLDYYTSTVFEVKSTKGLGSQDAIIAGGRYDNLLEDMGGKSQVKSVGFAAGVERIMLLFDSVHIIHKKIKIAITSTDSNDHKLTHYCLKVLKIITSDPDNTTDMNSFSVDITYESGSLSKRLKKVVKQDYDIVLVVGSDEVESDQVNWKDLKNSTSCKVNIFKLYQKIQSVNNEIIS